MCLNVFTFLCRVDGDHWTEGPLAFAVVGPDLDVEGREGRDAVVAVNVAGSAGR